MLRPNADNTRGATMRAVTRIVSSAVLLAVLSACGGGHPLGIPSRFDDVDPYAWRQNAPDTYPVHGIDVSRWQGQIDWHRVSGSGVAFAFIKATEGGDVADPLFAHHWQGATAAGIPAGAYHFYYHCRGGAEQALWFLENAPPRAGTLPPVLDIEWTQSRNCPRRPDPETVRAEAQAFLDVVTAAWGKRPVIYTTVDFWTENEMWRLGGYPFWLRSVAGHPQDTYGQRHWTFWQYTGTGRVPGIASEVDLNAFAGSEAEWQAWLAAATL